MTLRDYESARCACPGYTAARDHDASDPIARSSMDGGRASVVTSRMISGGSRSQDGTAAKVALATHVSTWHAQGVNPFVARPQILSCQA